MRIAVASTSKLKVAAVGDAFPNAAIFPFPTRSGVSSQPLSREETRNGAYNRLRLLKEETTAACCDVDVWVSMENGVFQWIEGSLVLVDQACVLIEWKAPHNGNGVLEMWSEALVVPNDVLADAVNTKKTIGEVLVERKEIEDSADPHPWLAKNPSKSRRSILCAVLKNKQSDPKEFIRQSLEIHYDFPSQGITFFNVLPVLRNPKGNKYLIDLLVSSFKNTICPGDIPEDLVFLGLESRGFLIAPSIAYLMGAACGVVRKQNKLPGVKKTVIYKKEYGEDVFEMAEGSIRSTSKVVLVDDLVATGGTLRAATKLVADCGGQVIGILAIIDLIDLHAPFEVPLCALFGF